MIVPVMKICRWAASMALSLNWLGLPPDVAVAAHDGRPSPPAVNDCVPVRQRIASEIGCFVLAREALGQLPRGPLYWHLYAYPTRSAAEAAKGSHGSVVEAEGRVWLFTVGERGWRPAGGTRVAEIGPIPSLDAAAKYIGIYLDVVFAPGVVSIAHRHAGPEMRYMLEGQQCEETPDGIQPMRPGDTKIIPAEVPMTATGIGKSVSSTLVLILYDESKPFFTPSHEWTPTGGCRQ
jgi:quercetin dioxygenase-like cupin family protein